MNNLSKTHSLNRDFFSKDEIAAEYQAIKHRLQQDYANDPIYRDKLLTICEQLNEFALGRFLIKNNGALSGYWTWYAIYGHKQADISNELEYRIVTEAPAYVATQERAQHFKNVLESNIQSQQVICSVPCGLMADLLALQLPKSIQKLRFVGIDLDPNVFIAAEHLATAYATEHDYEFLQADAWDLQQSERFDILVSNGLNIYEADDDKVTELYKQFYQALKSDGFFLGSALAYPAHYKALTEVDWQYVDTEATQMHVDVFENVLATKWCNYRHTQQTIEQLNTAGFVDVELIWDRKKFFYTFVARKR